MASGTLLLLTDPGFAQAVRAPLEPAAAASGITLTDVADLAVLEAAVTQSVAPRRLLAFCTGVIVPGTVLSRCDAGAFNLHPGPPAYPGLFPSCFAIYEGAEMFGVTLHRMTEEIDAGEIVHASSFKLPADADRASLDAQTFEAALSALSDIAERLCDLSTSLPGIDAAWSGTQRTRRDFDALCRLPEDITAEEFNRRYRAVGEGPDHALSITLFGHRFALDNQRTGSVVRGGRSN